MPSVSKRQRRFMGAELARLREGKATRTGMSEEQLEDFARGPVKKIREPRPARTRGVRKLRGR